MAQEALYGKWTRRWLRLRRSATLLDEATEAGIFKTIPYFWYMVAVN